MCCLNRRLRQAQNASLVPKRRPPQGSYRSGMIEVKATILLVATIGEVSPSTTIGVYGYNVGIEEIVLATCDGELSSLARSVR